MFFLCVTEIKHAVMTVKRIDAQGSYDGYAIVEVPTITRVTCDSGGEVALTLLSEAKGGVQTHEK